MDSQLNNFPTENLFAIASEAELIQSFRLRDQKKLILPAELEFPLHIRSYLTWRESSGVYTYLVFKAPNWDLARGVVFKRSAAKGEVSGGLCSWCHAYGASDEITMMTVAMDSNVSCGYILCQDLSCIDKIEEAANLGGKNPEKNIDMLYYRIGKLFENISNYRRE